MFSIAYLCIKYEFRLSMFLIIFLRHGIFLPSINLPRCKLGKCIFSLLHRDCWQIWIHDLPVQKPDSLPTEPVQQVNPFLHPYQTVPRLWFGIWNLSQSTPLVVWLWFAHANPYPGYSMATIYTYQTIPQVNWVVSVLAATPASSSIVIISRTSFITIQISMNLHVYQVYKTLLSLTVHCACDPEYKNK